MTNKSILSFQVNMVSCRCALLCVVLLPFLLCQPSLSVLYCVVLWCASLFSVLLLVLLRYFRRWLPCPLPWRGVLGSGAVLLCCAACGTLCCSSLCCDAKNHK